jgi:hypothetical protein
MPKRWIHYHFLLPQLRLLLNHSLQSNIEVTLVVRPSVIEFNKKNCNESQSC